jgi:hypothetical protein
MKKKITGTLLSSDKSSKKVTAIDEINKKLNSSAALNGGFDTLLFKIDKIEQSQGQLVSKVDKIHEAIYDPQEGIFSKLSEYKLENIGELNKVNQEIIELQSWKEHKTKEDVNDLNSIKTSKKKVEDLEKSVEVLVNNKNTAWAVIKWFIVALGGAIVTLIVTWIETKFR